jgi:MFS family permease
LPHFLHAKELKLANEIHSIIWSLTYTAGMALGGVVVNVYGVYTAIVVDLLFFVVAFGILISVQMPDIIKTASGSVWYEIKSGLRYIIDNKKVLYLMILHASVGLTAYDALIALLADVLYKELIAIALSIGIINAVRAVGLTLGPLVIGRFIHPNNLDIVMFLQGVFILVWGVMQPWFYLSLVAVFFTGVLTTSIWSLSYAMLQEATDKNFLGRVMSYNEMLFMSMSVLGSFLIGYLFDNFGFSFQEVTYTLGTLFILMSIYYRLIKRLVV